MAPKYGVIFLLVAVAASVSALDSDYWFHSLLAGNAAVAFFVVAIAYLGAGPRLLLKRSNGIPSPLIWPVLWPYLLLTRITFSIITAATREPAFAMAAPNLYWGRLLMNRDTRHTNMPNWYAVLDLTAELVELRSLRRRPGYRCVPLLDATAPSLEQLVDAVEWLRKQIALGPVYVHCAAGHGRSVAVVVAYLLATRQMASIEECVVKLRALRPGIGMKSPQLRVLREFASKLPGTAT